MNIFGENCERPVNYNVEDLSSDDLFFFLLDSI